MQGFRFFIIGLIILNPAIAMPAIAVKVTPNKITPNKKPVPSEAETVTATITRYQTAFFFEHDRFGETLKETMGKAAAKESKTYSYQIVPHPESATMAMAMTMITATPKQKGLSKVIALISGTKKRDKTNQSEGSVGIVSSILCKQTIASTTMPSWKSLMKPNNTSDTNVTGKFRVGSDCPAGFKEISAQN